MQTIATKDHVATIALFIGSALSVLFGVIAFTQKGKWWQAATIFSVIFFFVTLGGGIYQLKLPNVLIESDGKRFYVYHLKRQQIIPFTDVLYVDFRNTRSGRTVLKSGTLEITTKTEETIKIYNVKDVKKAAFSMLGIINTSKK